MSVNLSSLADNDYAKRLLSSQSTPEQFKVPLKVYFHNHNHAKFHFDLGGSRVKTVAFAGHRYVTDDKREQDQLDLVADVPGSFVYMLPDNEVAKAMQQELSGLRSQEVLHTAAVRASVSGQSFDNSTPIVEVTHSVGMAVVGMQSSLSNPGAASPISFIETAPSAQMRQPTAQDEALARIKALTPTS